MARSKLLTVQELSEWLNVKPGTIYSWTHCKQIPYYKLGTGVRFDPVKIERWLKKKEVPVYKIEINI